MQKIIGKLKDKNLYISLLITLVFFGIFIKMDFATDTYSLFGEPLEKMVTHFMSSGRFVTAFWWKVVNALHFGNYLIYFSSYALAIFCITLSIYNLFLCLNKKIKNEAICLLVSTITIINPFIIELFLFLEKGILSLAVLLTILTFTKFVKYLDGDKKALKYIFLFMLLATFSYQGIIGLFIVLSTVYIVCYSKNVKDFIKNNIIILLGYGIPAIINLLIIRLLYSNNRVSGAINLIESIQKIVSGSREMLETYTILPKYTFAILIAVLIVLTAVLVFTNKKYKTSTKALKVLGLVYVCFGACAVTILPQLMQNTESIWFVPRSTYPFGAIIGALCIYVLINALDVDFAYNAKTLNIKEIIKNKQVPVNKKEIIKSKQVPVNKLVYIIIGTITIVLLAMQLYSFSKIEIAHYNLNYLDRINSLKIGAEIKSYEQETGNKVTKICVYTDKTQLATYPEIWAYKDINISGFYPDWSIIFMINYYNNLDLTEGTSDAEIEERFKEQDWNDFSTDQIIFVGDTIHYCRF